MDSEKTKKGGKARKIIGIILNTLMYIFFAVCIFALIISVSAKKDADGAASIFGKQARIVVSESMAECDQTDVSNFEIKDIPVKSMVFIDLVPEDDAEALSWYGKLKVGDVITFRYFMGTRQETITHRIVKVEPKYNNDGVLLGYVFTAEGDNKASESVGTMQQTIDTTEPNSFNFIIGKVTGQSYLLGLLITAVKSPVGIVCIIIIPSLIIMVFEIFRLSGALREKKKLAQAEKEKQRESELEQRESALEEQANQLEELKRQLAALQQNMATQSAAQPVEETPDETASEEAAEEGANEENEEA